MTPQSLPCPVVGHRTFEKSIKHIALGDVDTPQQISMYVRPAECVVDDLGMEYKPGELQDRDMGIALNRFAYRNFLLRVFSQNAGIFRQSQCRIYQFQLPQKNGGPFIFGLIVTDGSNNLIDLCVETHQAHKRKAVLQRLIRAICTPESVARRLNH